MDSAWQQPEEWSKDGSTISGIAGLKIGAWTALFTAQETVNGKSTDIILKTFPSPKGRSTKSEKSPPSATAFSCRHICGNRWQTTVMQAG